MSQRNQLVVVLAAMSIGAAEAAVLSAGPDAWSRGDAGAVYFGWDVLEMSGAPGPFGNSTINDTTPDVGTVGSFSASLADGPTATYGHRSSTGNIYSGFTGGPLDLVVGFSAFGSVGSGSTTVFLTILGNPADTRLLSQITLDAGGGALAPARLLEGISAEDPNDTGAKVWVAEWRLDGHASDYEIRILSDPASGFGTDVGLDSITVDALWTSDLDPTANSSEELALGGVEVVPEPSSALLALLGALGLWRRRRVS